MFGRDMTYGCFQSGAILVGYEIITYTVLTWSNPIIYRSNAGL